jgi:HEAT repeat protein
VRSDIATTMPVLRGLAADKKNAVSLRKACIEAIGRMGTEAAGASESLGNILADDKAPEELHTASASVLASFGKEAKPAIPALIKAVNSRSRDTRCLAMQALSKMGKDLDSSRKEAAKALVKATDDFNVLVRVAAIEALAGMAEEGFGGETENVIKALEKIIKGGSRPEVVAAAKAAMEKVKPKK